jgi:hypothetical protein
MSIAYMPVRADMVALILKYSLKPDRHAGLSIQSPWVVLLGCLSAAPLPLEVWYVRPEILQSLVDALVLMLSHGASLRYYVIYRKGEYLPTRLTITRNFVLLNQEYADTLDELFHSTGERPPSRC